MLNLVLSDLFLEPLSVGIPTLFLSLTLEISGDLDLIALLFLDVGGVLGVVALV